MRAASCATPEWANRQFSRPWLAGGRPRRDWVGQWGIRQVPPRGPVTLPRYDRPVMASERVVIVGGGILGTMHAVEARRRGWEVTHLEADDGPRRASVRNFGLIWVSGRAGGSELDLALRAREQWEDLARAVPAIGFRPVGSVTVALSADELSLMAEAASRDDGPVRGFELLDGAGVRSVNPSIRGDVAGGLFCPLDAVVEPERVLGALRASLTQTDAYRWLPGLHAVDIESAPPSGSGGATVVDHRGGRHEGSLVLLCVGDRLSGLGGLVGAMVAAAPLQRCRLQMMETAPAPEHLTTALADGDTMRYYPAFDLPGRSRLRAPAAGGAEWGMQLLCVQRAGGGLTIGDTHVYDEPFDFAVDEAPYGELRARAEAILGWGLPPVVRRWSGVYSLTTDGTVYCSQRIGSDVMLVTGTAGRGMTLSPAIAERTWDEVLT
jgi:FAD dependent oxidoreductase TIGR03364